MTYTHDFPHVDIDILSDREALIIQLHYADGWSLRRIARSVGVNAGTISRQHQKALHVLCGGDAYCLGYGCNTRQLPFIEGHFEPPQDEGSEEAEA